MKIYEVTWLFQFPCSFSIEVNARNKKEALRLVEQQLDKEWEYYSETIDTYKLCFDDPILIKPD